MKSKLYTRLFLVVCFALISVLVFAACNDKVIYAETSDIESVPNYWDNSSVDSDNANPNTQSSNPTPGEDPTDGNVPEDDNSASDNIDTDGDRIPNKNDSDIDGDDIPNEKDPDIDGDDIPNEKDPDIDGDNIPNEGDTDKDGSIGNDDGIKEGPFVPFK